MGRKSKKVWLAIRSYYEKNIGTVAELCAEYDVTKGALYHKVRSEGWDKRSPRRAGNADRDEAGSNPDKKKSKNLTAAGAAGAEDGAEGEAAAPSVGERLFEVLELKLVEIEGRIARGEKLSAEENEREQRVIGNLIRNFDKLMEFNERRKGGRPRRGSSGGQARAGEDGAGDLTKLNAVQFREEIARRIKLFEATRSS